MQQFPVFSIALVVAALFSFLNYRFVRLPGNIGVTLLALSASLLLVLANALGLPLRGLALRLLEEVHFRETLLDTVLALLLFAGALHVDVGALLGEKTAVGLLATLGTLVSTAIIGALTHLMARALGVAIGFWEAMLFGALISPTDPIAVLGLLRAAKAPKRIEVQMAGESLFNDGVGVVTFFALTKVVTGQTVGARGLGVLLLREIAGGLALGAAVGWLAYQLLRLVDDYQVEVFMTLALAMGLYSLAAYLQTSGPLAVVVAGLIIGHAGRARAMSAHTVERLDVFWELVDHFLNVALFTLLGFEVLVVRFTWPLLAAGLLAIPIVLLARFATVAGTLLLVERAKFPRRLSVILTWGGLRGALAVALALSLTGQIGSAPRIVAMTYTVVLFSIIVQGLTFKRVLPKVG